MINQIVYEMRLREGETTEGIVPFLGQLLDAFPDKFKAFKYIRKVIIDSKCPKIRFDRIAAGGLSTTTECIISTIVLNVDFNRALYVILHEIAHQLQYTKYGENIAHHLYTQDLPDDELIDGLIKIEQTADRYAIAKTRQICNLAGIPYENIEGSYSNVSRQYILHHLTTIRDAVKKHRFQTIEQINDYLYNSIKIKLSKVRLS